MTTAQHPLANTYRVLASGAEVYIDAKGVATFVAPEEDLGCECEQDWSCHLHAGQPTWIETRYSELDLDPRERSDYVGF